MGFKENLAEKLKEKLDNKELELLPAGFQNLGEIIILNLKSELTKHKKIIGEKVLELYPKVKAVYNKQGEISGEFREPELVFIAGDKKKKEAEVLENGIKYKFDVTKLMFAKGNLNERVRIAREVKPGEIIVDMFAGIGYFSLGIGKLSLAKKIYSIEKNPNAFKYLNENIKINHIGNIESFNDDNRKIIDSLVEKGIKADRIVMGYLPPPKDFLAYALKISKKGTIIHYEDLLIDEKLGEEEKRVMNFVKEEASRFGFKVKLIKLVRVKNYKPRVGHYVLDVSLF
jgi:tRNA wybutosine-synthesizing protein 2